MGEVRILPGMGEPNEEGGEVSGVKYLQDVLKEFPEGRRWGAVVNFVDCVERDGLKLPMEPVVSIEGIEVGDEFLYVVGYLGMCKQDYWVGLAYVKEVELVQDKKGKLVPMTLFLGRADGLVNKGYAEVEWVDMGIVLPNGLAGWQAKVKVRVTDEGEIAEGWLLWKAGKDELDSHKEIRFTGTELFSGLGLKIAGDMVARPRKAA